MDFMFGDFYWRDHFDFTGRYDNSRLRGPLTAPNLVGKCWIRNDDSLYYWITGKNWDNTLCLNLFILINHMGCQLLQGLA